MTPSTFYVWLSEPHMKTAKDWLELALSLSGTNVRDKDYCLQQAKALL